MKRVAILGGARIPFARAGGAYAEASNQDMLTAALRSLVDKFSLKGEKLGEVAAGAVIKHSRHWNLARECTLGSGLHPQTPAYDLQRACGTSLSAAAQLANRIALGEIDSAIAGGADSASDVPLGYGTRLQHAGLKLSRSKSLGEKLSTIGSIRLRDLKPTHPGIAEPRTGMSMGQHCEEMAKEWQIGRREQDELALQSHKNAAAAWQAGFFGDLVASFNNLSRDNNVRPDTTLEKLQSLRTAFDAAGTLTAGNSSPLTDGAACVLLASEDWASSRRIPIQAYLTFTETAAVDFVGMAGPREGMLMAPAYAVPRMLDRAGLKLQDFDIYEIHEAFAAQVLCTLKAWESKDFCQKKLNRAAVLGSIDRSKMNPKGSSVAIGHPFAATGARIVATLAKQLAERGSGRGLISICAAGGMGVTAILER
ncbi:MAG: acetyl-CoA acetyltransferase [Betaproteobacteria bacterium RIFCSPLOWO2_02_FULL_67_26]|nr:MAG: acetyl-CoA acetyltransferase [Betaproteobacteria bacterium RIFCSPLOWO2_02_FULL_67_26]